MKTGYKCIYCESKIGHNTPGDIEHIIPSSKNRKLHFTWENLTVACRECNRRKNDYYQKGKEFLNPYKDKNIEGQLIHRGPLVYAENGNKRAEKTVRTLELSKEKRIQLILRKMEKIDSLNDELERYFSETDSDIKELLRLSLIEKSEATKEFSGMIRTILIEREIINNSYQIIGTKTWWNGFFARLFSKIYNVFNNV